MKLGQIIFAFIVLLLVFTSSILSLFGDFLWFTSVGYESMFIKILVVSLAVGSLSFIAFFAVSVVNILIARKVALAKNKKGSARAKIRFMMVIAAIVSLFVAIGMGASWETVLKFLNYSSFTVNDPVFGLDVGFYTFTLPFYHLALGFLFSVLVFSAIFSAITFVIHSKGFFIEIESKEQSSNPFFPSQGTGGLNFKWSGSWAKFVPHLSVLLFLIFMIIACNIWLARFGILYASNDAVYGAGYTELNVTLPVYSILSVISGLIGIALLFNIVVKQVKFIKYGIGAFFIIMFLGFLASGIVQGLVVNPDEFNLQKIFIERNIDMTLFAYGINNIQEKTFDVNYSLTSDDIVSNEATINNIRLWDWRPLKQTYEQLQLFRTYYDFNDVDVDRYNIDGMYKQVLVSARELDTRDLPEQAQGWVNTHLVYTHGYGVVMNPVDKVTDEGLPQFYIKNIPPEADNFILERPQIYFGEMTNDYVVVKTSTDELDYPSGDENIYTSYEGNAGVSLGDTLSRLIYATKFASIELLVSGSLTPESKILMYRNIRERVETIAPFLSYDPDPYLVIADNRLFWVIDAYTTTDMYPYSEPRRVGYLDGEVLNYIRNSVKVVVDVYNGDVKYYIVDDNDPLIKTYQKMFPELFLSFDLMGDDLKSHIRYPEGILLIQADVYSTYHMKDPRVFYNKEDVWVTPDEIYRGSRQKMQPYFIIMKLPDEEKPEFILMMPFTPKGKENMIGWMAARSDVPNYGKILVYQFSKQELTYGPMQIEARIDQDTEISQLITLWSQSGSSVLRGNTLVIPIENSILYVEPLYLEATERGTLPQLQRVIVSYENQLTMQDTLVQALDTIFDTTLEKIKDSAGTTDPELNTAQEKINRIKQLYNSAKEALDEGNLGEYQRYINEIGSIAES